MKAVDRLGIVGVGLIGGSLALAVRAAGLAREIVGLGRSRANLDVAVARGMLDRAGQTPEVLAGCDLVVLATPVAALAGAARSIAPQLRPGAVVTDAGSVKAKIIEECSRELGTRGHFVGSHPIAGTEGSGAGAAELTLFRGARCVLTPTARTDRTALARVRELWEAVGMDVVEMAPETHDAVLALTSHLPHLLAFSLVATAGAFVDGAPDATTGSGPRIDALAFAGPSFRDATRVAASLPETWRDIFLANRESIGDALASFRSRLDELAGFVASGDATNLMRTLEDARRLRRSLDSPSRGEP